MAENSDLGIVGITTEAVPPAQVNGLRTQHNTNAPLEPNGFHGAKEPPAPGKQISAEEYLADYNEYPDSQYEWNNGILEEKPVSNIAQFKLYRWFLQLISCYLEINDYAESAMFEFLAQMKAGGKQVKRKPDLLLVRNDNPNPLYDEDESYTGVCDLCVELLSRSSQQDIDRDIQDKKSEYADAGIREYFVLDGTGEYMEFYRLSAQGEYEPVEPDDEGIVSSEVLPGFQFRWDDLYRRPPLNALVDDPVYSAFVIPKYQQLKEYAEIEHLQAEQERERAEQERQRAEQERQRAEQERQRAEQERQRAEQESQRAEQESQRAEQESQRAEYERQRADEATEMLAQYAAQLRALGIDPDALKKE